MSKGLFCCLFFGGNSFSGVVKPILMKLMLHPSNEIVHGVPAGYDAVMLADMAKAAQQTLRAPVLHVCVDDAAAYRLMAALEFFAPEIQVLHFPAWDCLPYDRVSPHNDIIAQRGKTLCALAALKATNYPHPCIIITTVSGITQKIPPLEQFAGQSMTLSKGGRLDLAALSVFLVENGYSRTDTVRETGEFAFRGNIIDVFPSAAELPVRLDLFDDEIETIKHFDPMSQLSSGDLLSISLDTIAEIHLNKLSIQRFRARYRELFGAVTKDDPLYEAVSEGRKYAGMEHWLPLFYEELTSLFAAMPHAVVTLDYQAEESRTNRTNQIMDYYQARRDALDSKTAAVLSYNPVPPTMLYLDDEAWNAALENRIVRHFSPFAAADDKAPDAHARAARDFADIRVLEGVNLYAELGKVLTAAQKKDKKTLIACYSVGSAERLKHLMTEQRLSGMVMVEDALSWRKLKPRQVGMAVLPLEHGFETEDTLVLTEQDILGDRMSRPKGRKSRDENVLSEYSTLNEGDLVVHAEHGIGRFEGLETINAAGAPHECLKLIYAGDDKLFVPVENIAVLSRFGSDHATAQLDKLGGVAWQARKARVKKRIRDMADQLIAIAAKRKMARAQAVEIPDGLYSEFSARFPYQETDDQLRSIKDVLDDLGSEEPMDRLVCGDVGFGKTEVAMRAAFTAAMSGVQVALVVPTTLLARQHTASFIKRFAGFPLCIRQLSRMVTTADAAKTKQGLKDGSVDIVIGTHSLLSDAVKFANLGLLIVDEEQNFGVKQKEKLKGLKDNIHVLTLTATPIPRTMQLAMSGVRSMSIIATPPVDRLAVRTFVMPQDPIIIREALLREHFRGGQSFYVCPRIEDMAGLVEFLRDTVPEVKVVTAHGQWTPTELEERMAAFYDGKYDVLLATNIIESGLDIPSANTLIVHRADMFGLAQLYQIRGRIGRAKIRGYAYLTHPAGAVLNKQAQQRLHVMETLDTLGAGFQLASYDLDIRGAGNLLGEEQSGQIREVGVDLYQQMLEEAVQAAKLGKGANIDELPDTDWTPTINLGLPVMIPETYVTDLPVRLSLYRRLGMLVNPADIDGFAAEMVDRFGSLPEEVNNLLDVMKIKHYCKTAGIEKLDAGPKGGVISFRHDRFAAVERLLDYVAGQMGTVKIRPDQKLSVMRAWGDETARLNGARKLAEDLAGLVTPLT